MRGNKLYLQGLDDSISFKDIAELFTTYGDIRDITLFVNKGSAFIEMDTNINASKAMEGLNHSEFHGKVLHIEESNVARGR